MRPAWDCWLPWESPWTLRLTLCHAGGQALTQASRVMPNSALQWAYCPQRSWAGLNEGMGGVVPSR